MDFLECHECEESTKLVEDHNSGDLICTECGLVLESHLVDVRQEWRASELDASELHSQVRAERVPQEFAGDAQLFTAPSSARTVRFNPSRPPGSKKHRADIFHEEGKRGVLTPRLLAGFVMISTMGGKLDLIKTITDRALEVYKMMDDINFRGGRPDVVAIACLYTACQLEKNARTFKEIVAAADARTERRAISQASRKIHLELQNMGYSVERAEMSPAIYARRFCSHLHMNPTDVRAVLETVANSNAKLDIRRTPISTVAATIFLVAQLSDDKRTLAEVSSATGVQKSTISATYKQLLPFTYSIVPLWFWKHVASLKEEFGNFSNPRKGIVD